ncbi:MAG: type IV pilus twitching motility protein PilT [Pseudomonadota bacterium]
MARLDELLTRMKESSGSDLHLAAGSPPRIRQKGALQVVDGWSTLDDKGLRELLAEITRPDQWASYLADQDLDFAYGLPGVARFRANYFVQEHGAGAVFRTIPERILTLDELKLPPVVRSFAHLHSGLVLVTGPTGSGKSTTLAAIIDEINKTYAMHVVTIEDPVEFVHQNKTCVFSQREVGSQTDGFGGALRAAIRQDADVILVGEMRDLETIALAITAAEMGALVFGTLHTNSAAKTIDRLIDAFPAEQQDQIRLSLSESLAGIVAQLLLPTADGRGRRAANEILVRVPALANIIREGSTSKLFSLIQSSRAQGMQTMDDALLTLVREGEVRPEEAYLKANDKEHFEQLIKQLEQAPAGRA